MVVLVFPIALSHAESVRVQAQDNLCLVLDSETGAARALEIDGENVLATPGGLFVQDFAAGSKMEPARGRTAGKKAGSFVQSVKIESLGLGVETTCKAPDSSIRVRWHVRALRGQGRAIALSYRARVAEGGSVQAWRDWRGHGPTAAHAQVAVAFG